MGLLEDYGVTDDFLEQYKKPGSLPGTSSTQTVPRSELNSYIDEAFQK